MKKDILNIRVHTPEQTKTFYSLHYPNMSTSIQFINNAKGRLLVVLNVHSYIRDRQTGEKAYWRCENHKKVQLTLWSTHMQFYD